jgi:molybdopterin-guanine dinucleotide biosynthesis protein MobB
MKIIQVVGRSNSGKTTFINTLIPELKKRGRVAVVKHLGDHDFILEKGKDTTGFFETGADISAGIDASKAVISIREAELDDILRFLDDQKMDFVIIEGYKQRPFPRIVIGDLETDHRVLTNPTPREVVESLNLFQNFGI